MIPLIIYLINPPVSVNVKNSSVLQIISKIIKNVNVYVKKKTVSLIFIGIKKNVYASVRKKDVNKIKYLIKKYVNANVTIFTVLPATSLMKIPVTAYANNNKSVLPISFSTKKVVNVNAKKKVKKIIFISIFKKI